MDFLKETVFEKDKYDAWLARIHYDDRDVVMYENMLDFLWEYIVRPKGLKDRAGLLDEYTHWNMQMIDKCFHHMPHDLPYANVRRAYQSVIHLLDGNLEAGIEQLSIIGDEAFASDGKAPKLFMSKQGALYQPTSRLFLIYNYEKALQKNDAETAEHFRDRYPYAFRYFGDEEHKEHDMFYERQMKKYGDMIFYPVFDRIYKRPWGPAEFYLYFDETQGISMDQLPFV